MRMLNASNGVRIYGELDGISNHIYKLYTGLVLGGVNTCSGGLSEEDSEKILSDTGRWQARCSCYQPEAFRAPVKAMLDALVHPYGDRGLRYGFKEVVAGNEVGYMQMLLDLYPGAKIVHTLRHPRTFLLSLKRLKWMHANPGVHLDSFVTKAAVFADCVRRWPDRVAIVAYEEMNETVFRALWNWLEIDYGNGAQDALSRRVYAAGRPEIELDKGEEELVWKALARQSFYPVSSQQAWLSHVPGLPAREA